MRTHFVDELESVRKNFVQMGETTISLFNEALQAVLVAPSSDHLARASELEAQTDHQHRMIRDQCLNLITLQAPVACDARLLTGILDSIVDLELIGDYAYEIVTMSSELERRPPSQVLVQIADIGGKIQGVLSTAIDSWRRQDQAEGLSVRSSQPAIRAECESLYQKLSQLVATPGEGIAYVDLMLVCKHLERILRHAVCVAEQAADAAPLASAGSPSS